jgi:acetyl-CoA carboxylase carboxyltransferase component
MGVGGAVTILHKRELEAIEDLAQRALRHLELTELFKREHRAIEAAGKLVYDDVIDPADTRRLLLNTLQTLEPAPPRSGRKRVIEPF